MPIRRAVCVRRGPDRGCRRCVRTCRDSRWYSGRGSSEMGSPAAMRRPAKVGMKLQWPRPRASASICTTAVGGVCCFTQASASCWPGVTVSVHGNPGPCAEVRDVRCVVGVGDDGRRADGEDAGDQRRRGQRAPDGVRGPVAERRQQTRERDRDQRQQDLARPEPHPGRVRQHDEVEQPQADQQAARGDDAPAASAGGVAAPGRPARAPAPAPATSAASRPARGGRGPPSAIVTASPAPSPIALSVPQSDRQAGGAAATACRSTCATERARPHRIGEDRQPVDQREGGAEKRVERGRQAQQQAAGRDRSPAGPTRPPAPPAPAPAAPGRTTGRAAACRTSCGARRRCAGRRTSRP